MVKRLGTNLEAVGQNLYDRLYCARGEMENRIKEQQLQFFADRTSCHRRRPSQFRLLLASLAYVLMAAIRCCGLQGTNMARAQVATIRLKLLKIGAQVRLSVRRLKVAMASAYPWQPEWALAHARLSAAAA